mmetsp:Transcript_19918/g.37468  ORF Transcript_19918/g.37468 Transcript_19918/m.37468 type:complete len:120 (+) Transcript_19918:259-618(+)
MSNFVKLWNSLGFLVFSPICFRFGEHSSFVGKAGREGNPSDFLSKSMSSSKTMFSVGLFREDALEAGPKRLEPLEREIQSLVAPLVALDPVRRYRGQTGFAAMAWSSTSCLVSLYMTSS